MLVHAAPDYFHEGAVILVPDMLEHAQGNDRIKAFRYFAIVQQAQFDRQARRTTFELTPDVVKPVATISTIWKLVGRRATLIYLGGAAAAAVSSDSGSSTSPTFSGRDSPRDATNDSQRHALLVLDGDDRVDLPMPQYEATISHRRQDVVDGDIHGGTARGQRVAGRDERAV